MAKSPYIKKELGETLEVMKEIKKALTPTIYSIGEMGFDDSIKGIMRILAFLPLIERLARFKPLARRWIMRSMACIMCGFCRAGCPTYGETFLESIKCARKGDLGLSPPHRETETLERTCGKVL